MKFHHLYSILSGCILLLILFSCSVSRRSEIFRTPVNLLIPETPVEDEEEDVVLDSLQQPDDPLLMNAVREEQTGELYATDFLRASEVVAKFKTVAERNGRVNLSFDLRVPETMVDSRWQLKFYPCLEMKGQKMDLEPVFITGAAYREKQLKGYERYQKFIDSIILDPDHFIRKDLLEIFLQRNFPQIYRMKTDSSYVADEAQDLWGTSRKEVVEHYTRTVQQRRHQRRWDRREERFRKYVPDPLPDGGIRLDSVITEKGMLVYSYSQTVQATRGLKKMLLHVRGELYEDGHLQVEVPAPDTLEFYITSLTSLMEKIERKKMKIISRRVCDSTNAFINFHSARWDVDTAYMENSAELERVGRCIDRIVSLEEMILDSLVITATCSPEGRFRYNADLSAKRSAALSAYVDRFLPDSLKMRVKTSSVPENWAGLCRRVESDTLMASGRRNRLLSILMAEGEDLDRREKRLSAEKEYTYLRQKVYPALRTVSFDFHLHRPDMQQDTIHTEEPDLVYQRGLEAMWEMDYKTAVSCLRSYEDYNAALACVSADYNHSALEILERLEEDAATLYLKALVHARLGHSKLAATYLEKSISSDPALKFRAGLDPELSSFIHKTIKQ